MKSWFNAKIDGPKTATVRIFDQIGENWFGEGTSAKSFTDAVDALGEIERLNLHINSPGGNVFDGIAIYNYLRRHAAKVVVYVDGIAASIASIIAMAGDEIVMPENANMFIHNPWTFAGGDAAALRKTADELDTMRNSLIGIYMERIGQKGELSRLDVAAMMDVETMLTAEEAVAWGFADVVEEPVRMAASATMTMGLAKLQAEFEATQLVFDAQLEAERSRVAALENIEVELRAENALLTTRWENARALLETAVLPQPAMLAEDVIAFCDERGAPEWLATKMITLGRSEEEVASAVDEFTAVRDACAAAGIADPETVCRAHWDDTSGLVAALLHEAQAAADPDIRNRSGVNGGREPPKVDYGKAYASRKPKLH